MRIIESHDSHIGVPREQFKIKADIVLPNDFSCEIGLDTNDDPDAPYIAVKLTFYAASDNADQIYTVVFQDTPPRKPLEQIAVDGLAVLAWASDPDTDYQMQRLLNLVANQAYTPLAKVEVIQKDHWLDIRLDIGDWEGHHKVPLDEFKEKLGL